MKIEREDLKNFINRASEVLKEAVDERYFTYQVQHQKWQKNNPEKFKASQKKYENTEKGKSAVLKRSCTRYKNFKKACEELSLEELQLIRDFYGNCPDGYVVDHIIPISRGGKHEISNLQYLKEDDNFKKSDRTQEEYLKWLEFCDRNR